MKIRNILTVILVVSFLTSCLKNDNQSTGVGDAIIVIKKSGTETVYGISLYAYTFSQFKSVTAVSSADATKTYTLSANQGYKTNFFYETPAAAFSPVAPEVSTYTFSALFENGDKQDFEDILSNKVLPVPTIDKTDYDDTNNSTLISWTGVSAADSYAVNIFDGTTLIYASVELANTLKSYAISSSGGGWVSGSAPVDGKAYTVKLFAFLYESKSSGAYNVQATAIGEKQFTWGVSN